MSPDELRREVLRHQTACRCGHLLAACADCNGWLVENSPRIEASWRWYVNNRTWRPAGQGLTEYLEGENIAEFWRQRG